MYLLSFSSVLLVRTRFLTASFHQRWPAADVAAALQRSSSVRGFVSVKNRKPDNPILAAIASSSRYGAG